MSRDSSMMTRTNRPLMGFGLLVGSALATLAILIYLGAWAASDRIEARTEQSSMSAPDNAAWEEGLLFVCPFH